MSVSDRDDELFQHDVYERSYSDIRSLKARLPEDAVVSLAREVLKRLADTSRRTSFEVTPYPDDRVTALANALISPDPSTAAELVKEQRAAGSPEEAIYLGYLAPAARMLGEWWVHDKVTFAQVTTGSGRIYAILRSLRPRLSNKPLVPNQKSAFFAPVPDETHTLGIKMAADLLRDDGWDIELQLGMDHDELVDQIAATDHQVIGLSSGGEYSLASLARLIVAIRALAPKSLILVSGNIVEIAHDTVALMAPDAMAAGLQEARDALDELWAQVVEK